MKTLTPSSILTPANAEVAPTGRPLSNSEDVPLSPGLDWRRLPLLTSRVASPSPCRRGPLSGSRRARLGPSLPSRRLVHIPEPEGEIPLFSKHLESQAEAQIQDSEGEPPLFPSAPWGQGEAQIPESECELPLFSELSVT